MGLFSKFFSRENESPEAQHAPETPGAAADDKADAAPPPSAGAAPLVHATQSETAAVEHVDRPAPHARASATDVDPMRARASADQAIEPQPAEAAPVTPSAASASTPEQGALARETSVVFETDAPTTRMDRAAVAAKLSGPRPASPPAASKTTTSAARAKVPAPPPPAAQAAVKPDRPATRAEPAKTAAASATRAQPAPARKAAPAARATAEQAGSPKRAPKHTPPMFSAAVVPAAVVHVAREPAIDGTAPALRGSASIDGTAPALRGGASIDAPLAADVDAAVDTLLQSCAPVQRPSARDEAADRRAVAETFAAMAKLHAQPLRDFMFQLSLGGTPRQWAAACRPVVSPLLDASKQIGLTELGEALAALDAALERAANEPTACVGDASSATLHEAYARLHGHMPEAFAAIVQVDGGRLVLLESLLLQVPALHRRTLGKLYAAGLSSLPQLSQAKPEELAAVTGIDRGLAQRVVEHVQRFEHARSRVDPTAMRSHVCDRLRSVIAELTQLQAEFERAEQEENRAAKRAARRAREAAVLELEVLLCEVGDLRLIEELKRCAVRSKIERVESYLDRQASA